MSGREKYTQEIEIEVCLSSATINIKKMGGKQTHIHPAKHKGNYYVLFLFFLFLNVLYRIQVMIKSVTREKEKDVLVIILFFKIPKIRLECCKPFGRYSFITIKLTLENNLILVIRSRPKTKLLLILIHALDTMNQVNNGHGKKLTMFCKV